MIERIDHDSDDATDGERYDVRAYLHRYRDGQPCEGRIRLHADDCRCIQVAGVLVAGYRDVLPDSVIATALLDRLTPIMQGPIGLVVHHRDTSPHLATWLAEELKARTTIQATTTNYVPARKRRPKP